ncbi:MAG: hypothetical protein WAW59_04095 [Patescibacteria group bacterium]
MDRWWTKEERIELGVEELEEVLNAQEFLEKLQEVRGKIDEMEKELKDFLK